MSEFPRTSAFAQERARRVEDEAPGLRRVVGRAMQPPRIETDKLAKGATKKFGVTEVPTHMLEELNGSLRRMASYTNLPPSLQQELEDLADQVYSHLR